MSERLKVLSNRDIDYKPWFWRTTQQQEIDYIEERGQKLFAFEFKWNPKKSSRLPLTFSKGYPGAEFTMVNPDTIMDFLGQV